MALHGRKSLRQFQCNDALWVTFRRMAEDQEKEIDDVIGDALEAFAQLSGYQTGINESQLTPPPAARPRAAAPPPPPPQPPPPAPVARSRFTRPVPEPTGGFGAMFHSGPATPPPHPNGGAQPGSSAQLASSLGLSGAVDGTPSAPTIPLYLVFDNQKYRIDKDQFIIGRGTKSSDLPIKDGNISRKHAAVIRRNGTYFIKDLGSTNGIDFKGMRIDNKRIDEGDLFHLCDYELRFTYKR
ncbi:MAG TPA: FHA domain-containing protein [Polyangia bacterium]|nr:FHA domain-containing protein [Polyangia bacterium]